MTDTDRTAQMVERLRQSIGGDVITAGFLLDDAAALIASLSADLARVREDHAQCTILWEQDRGRHEAALAKAVEDAQAASLKVVEGQIHPWVKEKAGDYWIGYRDAIEDAAEDLRAGGVTWRRPRHD